MKAWQALLVVAGAGWVCSVAALPAVADEGAPLDAIGDATGRGEGPSTSPGAAAETKEDEIASLIGELGASDFKARDAAVEKLKRIGQAALPALKRATESDDPEVASRADSVIRHLQRPPLPSRTPGTSRGGRLARGGAFRGGFRGGAGVGDAVGVQVTISEENGTRRVDVREPGRTVRINEGPNGIQMAVTDLQDGKQVTRDFAAKSPEQLQKENPEAFKLYDRWAGRGGALQLGRQFRNNAGMMRRRAGGQHGIGGERPEEWQPLLPPPQAPRDELAELQELLARQMDEADTPEAQRREVMGLLERLRLMRGGDPLADEDRIHRQLDGFNREADALRDRLKGLDLPDPGATLPPPEASRLGISVLEDPDEGVTVVHVIPDGRAQKLGIQPLDVIKTINGKPVINSKDLRRAVTEAKPPLLIEGTRDGEPLKLEEKAADGAEKE